MKLVPVKSSAIQAVGYDPATQEMHVKFGSGQTYTYSGVKPETHSALMAATSKGKHFAQHFRSPKPAKVT